MRFAARWSVRRSTEVTGILIIGVALTLLSACGGKKASTKHLAWGEVTRCYASHKIQYSGLNHSGDPSDPSTPFPPFSFSDAPGGWIVLDLGQAQSAYIMFYSTALEAGRVLDQGGSVAFHGAKTVGNVVLGYDAKPTSTEASNAEQCLR